VLKHRRVGLERDVDRCHRILLRDGPLDEAERQREPEANGREDWRMMSRMNPTCRLACHDGSDTCHQPQM
jgi:hypothetical protein